MDSEDLVIDSDGVEALIAVLEKEGFDVTGPVVRDGAIVPGPLHGIDDLPRGCHDQQAPGSYRLEHSDDHRFFAWAVGPGSWKAEVFPPSQELWRARVDDGALTVFEPPLPPRPMAVVGARPCELAALDVLGRVLEAGQVGDPVYAARGSGAFLVVVECGSPGGTCFCVSMETGPSVEGGFDLAMTELHDKGGHRFLVRVGSERGAAVMQRVESRPATSVDQASRRTVLDNAVRSMGRHLDTEDLPAILVRNLENPRWDDVAERCLSCGNCTSVCPTCFCSDVRDTTDVTGEIRRERTWASCFDLEHSYLQGGAVRTSGAARYRQWLTHKLSTWWEQFETSGCVGCGRCITWCPVGIDLTEEAAALRASDGAVRLAPRRGTTT
jgi:ferredoxin